MTEKERIQKNNTIKETLKKTRERHLSMRPLVVEMKLDLKCLNKRETAFSCISPSAAGFAIISFPLMLMHSDLSIPEQGT